MIRSTTATESERNSNMKKMLGYCGIDCQQCDAYKATVNDDWQLRKKTAELWSQLNQAEILPEHINCLGCKGDGVKTVFCGSLCAVRKCAVSKGLESCGYCDQLESCPIVAVMQTSDPSARENLMELKK